MAMEINIIIDGDFEECPDESRLRSLAEQVLLAQDVSSDVELGIVITTQERVQELNRSYRGQDKPTDVLAFYMTSATGETFVAPPDGIIHLGEVIISYPQAVIQAKEQGHSLKRELAILIIHGMLHLLGYDHKKPDQRKQIRAKEAEILNSLEVELE
jgi:probable rRNA maturation factor